MIPKKSLGQNFLRDPKILRKIADSIEVEKKDTLIEVGGGEGTLTKFLLNKTQKLVVVEKDTELAELLKSKFEKEIQQGGLEIVSGDILKYLNLQSSQVGNYVLVGNIPYYLTGILIKKTLEAEILPKSITFVIQKEVAERIVAKDGKESLLSISVKAYGKPKINGLIKAGSFFPKPKVDSAILTIQNIRKSNFVENDTVKNHEKFFFKILKAGFAHKRKLLIKNLGKFYEKSEIESIFKKLNLDTKIRAENLKLADWLAITSIGLK